MSTATTLQSTFINSKPIAATIKTTRHSRQLLAAPSRKTMTITQTYYLAHKARAKLSREAAQSDHDLRLLVGHANLLDSLMAELAEAEREQERWFNQSVRNSAAAKSSEKRHIQWADRIAGATVEEDEYEAASSDSDSDSDLEYYDEEDAKVEKVPIVTVEQVDAEEDDEEDYAQLELVRAPSHTNSPPELLLDQQDSDSSDDEAKPPSPAEKHLPEAARAREEEEYYSRRNAAGLVSTVMVY
ncbi:hypothetical protein MY11210_001734 [Beauveria gryllotalpidicola]